MKLNAPIAIVLASATAITTTAANANCDAGMSTINGQMISSVAADVEGGTPVSAANAVDCCKACQKEAGCAYSQYSTSQGCTITLIGGACSSDIVVGSFNTSASYSAADALTMFNGPCGALTYGGSS